MQNIKERVEEYRKIYPEGTRVELVFMDDSQAPKVGTRGTVTSVDDASTIHINWDNGSCLGVCPEVDKIKKI